MADLKIFLLILLQLTLTQSQDPQQDNQQQSGSCPCPCQPFIITGPTGQPGVQGPQGLTGPAGNPGSNGIPGQNGGPGVSVKGEKGDAGQGSKGDIGSPGLKGDHGLIGLPGPRGHSGKVGPQGAMGLQGVKGDAGHMGVKGEKGEPSDSSIAPSMSAFSARITSVQHVTSGTETITFREEDIDIGDDFYPNTGVFTCRIQGLYYFSFTILPHYEYDSLVYLQQNSNNKAKIFYKSGSSYVMQSQSVILSLQVGDEVKLVAQAPSQITHSYLALDNIFNGYLIHAM